MIQYIYAKYGRERAGLASAVTTYRARSAIRETAKVFGLSEDVIVALNSLSWGRECAERDERAATAGLDAQRSRPRAEPEDGGARSPAFPAI